MKPPADYDPPPYPLPDGKALSLLTRWEVPEWCPWVVVVYCDWTPYRCAIERLPFEGERVLYQSRVLIVVDRKYTLPAYGRAETWLRLESENPADNVRLRW